MNYRRKSSFVPAAPSPLLFKHDEQGPPVLPIAKQRESLLSSSSKNPNIADDDTYDYYKQNDEPADTPQDLSVPPVFFNLLRTFPLFKEAPTSFHTKVVSKLRLMQYHSQEYIIKEGDPSRSMYWILKGTVSVTSTDGESIYAELAAGSFFGEIGILFNRPRTATVVARTKVLLGVLTSDALSLVLKSYPLVERRIRDEAQERLAMQDKKNKADIQVVKSRVALHVPAMPTGEVASLLAHQVAPVPGPSLPPMYQSALSESTKDNVDHTISIQEFIKGLPIFHNLPSHIVHRLALGVEPMSFQPFEYIFHKNDTDSDIYFIVHGEVEVVDYCPEKKVDNVLARLKPGSYFGEMTFLAFLNKEPSIKRSASIRSVTAVELIVVRSDKLESLCNKYPFIVDDMRTTANQRKSLNSTLVDYSVTPSPAVSMPPLRRLSINFLINDGAQPMVQAPHPQQLHQQIQQLQQDEPLFSPNWGFSMKQEPASGLGRVLRSISPISGVELDAKSATTRNTSVDETPPSRKRKSVSSASSFQVQQQQQQMVQPLNIKVPPLNPVPASIHNFQNFHPGSRRSSFQYMPHNKRFKMANLNGGRRRSSILSNNGPLPDTILLKVFEYLTLPELMKLRIISRRWRQLLYFAPNLFEKLDLTPWNTSIDDQVLISITDFVGSRPNYINISNCFHITDEGFTYMVNEIGIQGKITTLKMRSNWEVSAMAIMDLTVPSVGRHLEEIDLSNCRRVRDHVLERLIGWDPETSTDPHNNDVGCKNLKILNVGYCKHLTDGIMHHIALHANKRLESLDLTRCTTITDKGFQHWMYRSFPNLKKLSLKDCTFLTDKSIVSIANAATNLEILDLNFCCALSDIAIEVLCLGCPNIRELDLSFCGSAVSDSSLVTISLHMRNLERLVLKGCVRVTRAGIDALLSGCPQLNYINVSQCRNAHIYPGRIPAQKLNVNAETKSAFVTAGTYQNIIEIVI